MSVVTTDITAVERGCYMGYVVTYTWYVRVRSRLCPYPTIHISSPAGVIITPPSYHHHSAYPVIHISSAVGLSCHPHVFTPHRIIPSKYTHPTAYPATQIIIIPPGLLILRSKYPHPQAYPDSHRRILQPRYHHPVGLSCRPNILPPRLILPPKYPQPPAHPVTHISSPRRLILPSKYPQPSAYPATQISSYAGLSCHPNIITRRLILPSILPSKCPQPPAYPTTQNILSCRRILPSEYPHPAGILILPLKYPHPAG